MVVASTVDYRSAGACLRFISGGHRVLPPGLRDVSRLASCSTCRDGAIPFRASAQSLLKKTAGQASHPGVPVPSGEARTQGPGGCVEWR